MPRPVHPRSISCKCPLGPQTLFLMPRPVDPRSFSCKYFSAHKPYFSYHVPSTQVHSHASNLRPTNLIFHTNFSSPCHVPSTQLHSHASTLRPTNLISHTTSPVDPALLSCKHPSGPQTLFLIPRPVDPASLSCKCPSAHKPYFSYHFFEHPVNPASFSCKYPSTHKPYFSYYVPSTQVHSHASTFRPTNLISHTNFSSACHVPSTQLHSHTSVH